MDKPMTVGAMIERLKVLPAELPIKIDLQCVDDTDNLIDVVDQHDPEDGPLFWVSNSDEDTDKVSKGDYVALMP